MAYINNLFSYTKQTTPASPYAPPPSVVCDFGWFNAETSQIFGNLLVNVAGNVYPPPDDTNPEAVDYVCEINQSVTFDCYDTNALGLPKVIIPAGYQIVEYAWDLGNGQLAQGPLVTTTYKQITPDAAVTLTVIDSLNRRVSTTRRLNFIVAIGISGQTSHSVS